MLSLRMYVTQFVNKIKLKLSVKSCGQLGLNVYHQQEIRCLRQDHEIIRTTNYTPLTVCAVFLALKILTYFVHVALEIGWLPLIMRCTTYPITNRYSCNVSGYQGGVFSGKQLRQKPPNKILTDQENDRSKVSQFHQWKWNYC